MSGRNRRIPKPGQKNKVPPSVGAAGGMTFEEDYDYQVELCWCIQKLQMGLNTCKSRDQAALAVRTLRILQNPDTAKIKKRQTMKSMFGDYRGLMKREELERSKVKQTPCPSSTHKMAGRVIHHRQTEEDKEVETNAAVSEPFLFNFDIVVDEDGFK